MIAESQFPIHVKKGMMHHDQDAGIGRIDVPLPVNSAVNAF